MPRARSATRDDMLQRALRHFWVHGFANSSLDDLVRVTEASRHAIYAEFGSKDGLFAAVMDLYAEKIVTPAFAEVEAPGAGLGDIANFWEFQIARGEQSGFPGSGCLFANTMTEVAPHVPSVLKAVAAHNARLRAGFRNALRGDGIAPRHRASKPATEGMAVTLAIFTNGLWSFSRVVSDARPLRLAARSMTANLSVQE
jgi:TetR/AcrR family transcriptional regulator, transcriptional repressor for nem operon